MKKTIWKFPLEVTDKQFIKMPIGSEIISVQNQLETPCLWAIVNPDKAIEERCFELFGTGHNMPDDMGIDRKFIGTFQLRNGDFVGHLFERN